MNFQKLVYKESQKYKRTFPWRKTTNPYNILVSEIMLQQTQTKRVVPKYISFLNKFPTVDSLAHASTATALTYWQGLGYNRRALYLKKCAEEITQKYKKKFPQTEKELRTLPGIGPYTAAAIISFAYNKPAVVIETNIRTVYIHHYFNDAKKISDKELIPLIEKTMDRKNPRKWYNSLMDYGAALKKIHGNISQKSSTYIKQSTFKGSTRELRGKILRELSKHEQSYEYLKSIDKNAAKTINTLEKEGFITISKKKVMLKE